MNNRRLLLSLSLFFVISSAILYKFIISEPPTYTPRSLENQIKTFGFNDAAEWIFNIKKNQVSGIIDNRDVLEARKAAMELAQLKGQTALSNISWNEVGPDNMGGRTRSIVIDKNNPNILYAGGVAGGIFKSVTAGTSWVKLNDNAENLAVSCMAQCPVTGHIYAGTGEGLANPRANPVGGTAFIGKGVYKSTDGNNFSLLSSTIPTVENSTSADWATVNEIAIDENGWVYAATNKGLRLSKDGGITWNNPIIYPLQAPYNMEATDVNIAKVGNNKTVIVSVNNRCFVSNTGDSDYVTYSTTNGANNTLPFGGVSRIEFAIAPSNPNYIYACAAKTNGNLLNVYRSTDKSETWEIIGVGGTTTFEPLRNQGWYNNTIAVFPNNPNKIILGGIDVWGWELGGNWTQRSLWYLDETNPYYVHADIHKFVFHPTQPNTFYVGSDGGVSRSTDGGISFQTINKNFNTIQFYAIAASASGEVMGGTQDNGTIYISKKGNTVMNGKGVMGGDGGYSAFSIINPNVFFATTYYAGVGRSFDRGETFYPKGDGTNPIFSDRMLSANLLASFVTPLILWETFNDIYSPDSVLFKAVDTSYTSGTVVAVKSKNGYFFDYTLPQDLNDGESMPVKDIIQARFYVGFHNAVWMTREALDFSVQPEWFEVAKFNGTSTTMSVSKCGNFLFVGTEQGPVYRISNLRHAYDSLSADVSSPFVVVETKRMETGLPSGRVPTSIAIDPTNANHVIITYGNYGNNAYVYRSTNALSASPTFTSKQGNLPKMPVYGSIIEMNNSSVVIIGTEYGVFATDNITAPNPQWVSVNNQMANVPVYMVRQQVYDYPGVSNYGVIYLGTHGRGAFESFTYMSNNPNQHLTVAATKNHLKVYPNPAKDYTTLSFTLSHQDNSQIFIYDISGRLVKSQTTGLLSIGNHEINIDCRDFRRGTYIAIVKTSKQQLSSKFIVQ